MCSWQNITGTRRFTILCDDPGREVGGHWDSGLPYLQLALKKHWVPMGDPADPLQGVQLLLDHIDVAPLKVTGSYAGSGPLQWQCSSRS